MDFHAASGPIGPAQVPPPDSVDLLLADSADDDGPGERSGDEVPAGPVALLPTAGGRGEERAKGPVPDVAQCPAGHPESTRAQPHPTGMSEPPVLPLEHVQPPAEPG